jgi:hypothetical protein
MGSLAPTLGLSLRLEPMRRHVITVMSRRATSADGRMAEESAILAWISILALDKNFMPV